MWIEKTSNRIRFANNVLMRFKQSVKGRKIFVKPNIVSFEPYPTTTHPDVLATIIKTLQRLGCEIVVADGPAPDAGNAEKIIQNHPLQKVCKDFNIKLLNLHKQPFKKIDRLKISALPFECDFYISLPVLKSHPDTGLTGALKNQFGLLANRQRIACHIGLMNIHKVIAQLNKICPPNLTIMDFVESYRSANEVRHGGIIIRPGWMLAGPDAVKLDIAGFKLLKKYEPRLAGKSYKDITHIRLALENQTIPAAK
ncbi:MAG: DUF362 domain-containing protein [Candidatus Aenigmatarchaeota archaeon]